MLHPKGKEGAERCCRK